MREMDKNNLQEGVLMSEQNQRFHSHNQADETPVLTPSHKLIKRKLCQLQNKAYFFQGQLNPLVGQNQKLKSQLTLLNKSVIASTDLLRSLLPIGSCQTKRLKLQLASIEEICEMIREDWYMMEEQIERKTFAIDVLEKKILSNREEGEREMQGYKRQMEMVINKKDESIFLLQQSRRKLQINLQSTKLKYQQQLSSLTQLLTSKSHHIQHLQKQLTLYSRQVQAKYRQYQKALQRLKIEIASNLAQFQEGKKNLREIYDKLMSEKLEEQAEMFELLLRGKEEEKDRLMAYYQERQEERDRCLNQKCLEIGKLLDQNQRKRGELEKKHIDMLQCKKFIEQLQQQAHHYKTSLQSQTHHKQLAQQLLKQKQLQLQQKQRLHQQHLTQINKNRSISQQELNSKIQKLSKEYKKLNEEFSEKSEALRQVEKSLATVERRYERKLEEEKQKWAGERQLLEEKANELQQLVQQKQALIQEQLTSIQQMTLKHEQSLNQSQQKSAQLVKTLKQQHEKQLNLINSSASQQLAFIKRQNQRILSQQRIKSNLQLQKFHQQLITKMTLKQQQFNNLKNQLQQQIMSTLMDLKQKQLQIKSLQLLKQQANKLLLQTSLKHKLQLQQAKDQSIKAMDELSKKCQQEKKKIQQEMVNQLIEFQAEMEKRSVEYQQHLDKIQTEMMKEINMLKSSNALQELQAKYLGQITSLRQHHQQQLITMQQKQKQSQQSLVQQQKRHIQRLILQYEQDMTRLAKKLQSDIENLNSELFDEQHQHEITKMTREEKILYLSKKINELKIISEQKENQILELQLKMQEFQKEQDRMNQIIEDRVNMRRGELEVEKNQFLKECQVSADKTKQQAQKKVSQVQKDRLQHSHSMYQKFHQLKQLHQQELDKLQKRYSQLEKLFAQRPSRAEDLTKIKELIEIKEKMDLEMKTYHKKVQHANQIVKYLNLELQNYKDNYDMFGPCDEFNQKPVTIQTISCESPIQSIMKLKRANYKIHTQNSQAIYSSQNKYETTTPKINNLRISNDSPSFREFQLYPGTKLNESQTLIPPESSSLSKIPYIRKSPEMIVNNRIKKASSIDKSGEIVLNAENFLKLISDNSRNGPVIRENKSNDRRAYRKSKPRKLNTLGMGNGESYSLARRQSFDQEFH